MRFSHRAHNIKLVGTLFHFILFIIRQNEKLYVVAHLSETVGGKLLQIDFIFLRSELCPNLGYTPLWEEKLRHGPLGSLKSTLCKKAMMRISL